MDVDTQQIAPLTGAGAAPLAPTSTGNPRPARLGLILLVLAGLGFGACGSMSKARIEEQVRSLPSNALPASARLVQADLDLVLGGRENSFDVRWLEIPANAGAAGEPPLVLIHGTPGTLFTWTPILFGESGLAGSRPIYALEVIGHGFARDRYRPYSFASCGRYVAAWLRGQGLQGVDLVGHSYGGEICLEVALEQPELVGRLVLMNSSGIQRRDDEFLPEEVKMREWSVARFGYLLNSAERVELALEPHFREPVRGDFLQEITLSCEASENWRAMVALCRDENGNRQSDLGQVGQPTLLLWGAEDIAYPVDRFAKAFEEAIPDARLAVIEGAGHYPFEERPAETAAALLAFLEEPR